MSAQTVLEMMQARRSVRRFEARPVPRDTLTRLIEAATSAPSATNRQPWRFAVVQADRVKRELFEAVRSRTEEMKEIVARGHHGRELGDYWDYFYRPLETAPVLIVPQYRVFDDLMARLLESGGGDASQFETSEQMQVELCATSAAVMALLLQAHAEGLGACWMSGPMVARQALATELDIRHPWQLLGVVALGYPAEQPAAPPRRPLSRVVHWFDETETELPTEEQA